MANPRLGQLLPGSTTAATRKFVGFVGSSWGNTPRFGPQDRGRRGLGCPAFFFGSISAWRSSGRGLRFGPQNRLLDRVGDDNSGEYFGAPRTRCEGPFMRFQPPRGRQERGDRARCWRVGGPLVHRWCGYCALDFWGTNCRSCVSMNRYRSGCRPMREVQEVSRERQRPRSRESHTDHPGEGLSGNQYFREELESVYVGDSPHGPGERTEQS